MNRTRVIVALALLVAVAVAGYALASGSDSTDDAELAFANASAETGLQYASKDSGAGGGNASVYAADYDNDNWTDVLAIGGSRPVLFTNQGGEFRRSGQLPDLDVEVHSALFFDYDNDGWQDLLLLPDDGEAVFLHNDHGEFRVREVGLEVPLDYPTGATAADYDRDGCSDVFIYQSGDWVDQTPIGYNTPLDVTEDNGNPNILLNGDCSGFERAADANVSGQRWSLAASFVDLDGNGWPDIHVANDYNNDTLYLNRNGSFRQVTMGGGTDRNGMSSEVEDVNGDARSDLFVTNIYLPLNESKLSDEEYRQLKNFKEDRLGKRARGNNLLVNQGNGSFSYEAGEYGLQEGGWGWAAVLTDFDNDGRRDAFHTTETFYTLDEDDPHLTYPMLWQRTDGGFESRDASDAGFEETDGRGVAELDFDRDGDQDLVVAHFDGRFVLYENRVSDGGNWLNVRVPATEDRTALGAEVYVTVDGRTQFAVRNAKVDFLSQDTRALHFGVGDRETVDRVRVVWPDGSEATYTDVAANRTVVARRGGFETLDRPSGTNATAAADG
jgi:hypothetical protein